MQYIVFIVKLINPIANNTNTNANENFTQSEFENSSANRPHNNNNVSVDVIRFLKKFTPIILCGGEGGEKKAANH